MSAVQTVTAPVSLQPHSAYRDQFVLLGHSEALQAHHSLDDALSGLDRMMCHNHVSNLDILVGKGPAKAEIFQELGDIISSPERPD